MRPPASTNSRMPYMTGIRAFAASSTRRSRYVIKTKSRMTTRPSSCSRLAESNIASTSPGPWIPRHDLDAQLAPHHLDVLQHRHVDGIRRVGHDRDARRARNDLLQELEQLADGLLGQKRGARDVAAGPREARDQLDPDRVADPHEDDGNARRGALGRQGTRRTP